MATYYFSYTLGSPANSGLSAAAPKQYLFDSADGAALLWKGGHTILLASGDIWPWDFDGTNHRNEMDVNFAVHNGQFMGVYESALGLNHPIIDGLYYQTSADDGSWTDLGSNRWSRDFSAVGGIFGFGNRIWPGMTGPTIPRNYTPLTYMGSSAASIVAEGQYTINSEVITIWAPSGGAAPPSYYGGLGINARHSQGTVGTGGPNIRMENVLGEYIRDPIELRGNQQGLAFQTTARDVTLNDLRINSTSAFNINLLGTDDNCVCTNIRINRPIITGYTSLTENLGAIGNNDGIRGATSQTTDALTGAINGCEIVDPRISSLRHSALNFQVARTSYLNVIRGIIVRTTRPGQSVIDGSTTNYMHALDFVANGWNIQGVDIIDSAAASQLSGSGVLKGCNFLRSRGPDAAAGAQNAGGVNAIRTFHYPSFVSTTNIVIAGNTFTDIYNFSIGVGDDSGTPMTGTDDQVIIENNTFNDQMYYSVGRTQFNQNFPPNLWTFAGAGTSATVVAAGGSLVSTSYFPICRNNIFILPTGATGVYGKWTSGTTITTYDVNTGPGVGAGYVAPTSDVKYDSLTAAGLSGAYRPSAASPDYRAGTHYRYTSDPTGLARYNPPTRGAYEVAP